MVTRPYQGFPYTQPHVTDVPSIDAATASQWTNLPRRLIRPDRPTNIVYVDLPDEGGSQVSIPNNTPGPGRKKVLEDLETPVIYIDVPASSSSYVASPATPEPEPEYVQETIFFDPFENRRIDQRKDLETPQSDSGASSSSGRPTRPAPARPPPPNTLNLSHGASGSSGYGATYSSPAGLPASLSKEAAIYGRRTSDDFPLSPIPVSEFPEPPPAYCETVRRDNTQHEAQTPQTSRPERPTVTPTEPPRTIVITQGADPTRPGGEPSSPIGLPNPTRKVVNCHHCGQRVHTLVIWENGPITHIIALMLMCLMLIPLIILVYWTNYCKYQNHYCPNCNKKIGYEFPLLCINMTYTTGDNYAEGYGFRAS